MFERHDRVESSIGLARPANQALRVVRLPGTPEPRNPGTLERDACLRRDREMGRGFVGSALLGLHLPEP